MHFIHYIHTPRYIYIYTYIYIHIYIYLHTHIYLYIRDKMFARLSPLRFLVALGVLVVKQTLLPTLRKSLGIFLQNAHLVAQEPFTRATTVSSGPNFLAMEVGPLWLFLSYVAVAGFTHLVSTGLHSSHDHKKQAQLPPSTEFMQSTVETAPCGLMDFFNKHKEGPGIDKWAAG